MRTSAYLAAVVFIGACISAPSAFAQDLFDLFGSSSNDPIQQAAPPPTHLRVTKSFRKKPRPAPAKVAKASRLFCVRTCDGRYYPIAAGGEATCQSICPNAETSVFKGSSIETAVNKDGRSYARLPNALRFRNEMVPQCSCLASSTTGLSYVNIDNDPTIRSGDIVANANGLMVASKARRSRITFRPISRSRIKAERLPAVSAVPVVLNSEAGTSSSATFASETSATAVPVAH
ncbi:hypothetical protein X566_07825 [Afipia sp. P52-10]|uniref:DUF2865 domain-containing protein n=1 Tax=Afipia sp. P52-10 TaxID=1429916 RepID=UPI0003DF3E46|nr:DUF2865 domain-containing protein [Afipia sp. P52-10]ETR77551.1 hypothetical protein X566_07825 [Afipia sp. P52-10]